MNLQSFHRSNPKRLLICTRHWSSCRHSTHEKARVVELKYFGGLNYDEIAEVLKIARATARRDWELRKLWLYTELHNAP